MPARQAVLPPEHDKEAKRLRKALSDYLDRLEMLEGERNDIVARFMERIERGKLDEVRRMIDSMN